MRNLSIYVAFLVVVLFCGYLVARVYAVVLGWIAIDHPGSPLWVRVLFLASAGYLAREYWGQLKKG